ncbi:MAG: HAMP domain-containing histidine kinase [Clostridia bacterium]|nr:HAMP domain-containing histidine kinase [Clostridia bacterium]
MKLSLKFFCVAYLAALLSASLGGFYLIRNIQAALWNGQTERFHRESLDAADRFAAFADLFGEALTETQKKEAIRQIRPYGDKTILDVRILSSEEMTASHRALRENVCEMSFVETEDRLLMESALRLQAGGEEYCLWLQSDFTEIQRHCDSLRGQYRLTVLCTAAITGVLLFLLSLRLTRPLNRLMKVADGIAKGNYGNRAVIGGEDEIAALAESVNAMSVAIDKRIGEIRRELEKRNLFVADFTHEMKTPMTAIIGYAQMLSTYELEGEEKRAAAREIFCEAKRLEKLSLQLLDYYLYQNRSARPERLSLAETARRLKAALHFSSVKYGVHCRVELGEETVSADPILLMSLLLNLADNAFKASKPQSEIRIFSEVNSDANRVRICVEDHGRGIEKEHLPWLTEPFYRVDKGRSRQSGGTGLGLALCREIARLHGTELFFESQIHRGTKVSFTLPREVRKA